MDVDKVVHGHKSITFWLQVNTRFEGWYSYKKQHAELCPAPHKQEAVPFVDALAAVWVRWNRQNCCGYKLATWYNCFGETFEGCGQQKRRGLHI